MWLTTIPYERDGSALALLGVALRALQERGEAGMSAATKERADQPEDAREPPQWRVKASEYATDLKPHVAMGVRLHWMHGKPLAMVATEMGLPISIAREAVREGIEHCIGKYLRHHVTEIANPDLRKACIRELMTGLSEVTNADDAGSPPPTPLRRENGP